MLALGVASVSCVVGNCARTHLDLVVVSLHGRLGWWLVPKHIAPLLIKMLRMMRAYLHPGVVISIHHCLRYIASAFQSRAATIACIPVIVHHCVHGCLHYRHCQKTAVDESGSTWLIIWQRLSLREVDLDNASHFAHAHFPPKSTISAPICLDRL